MYWRSLSFSFQESCATGGPVEEGPSMGVDGQVLSGIQSPKTIGNGGVSAPLLD